MHLKEIILRFYKILIFWCKKKINLDLQTIDIKSLNKLFNHFGTDKGTEVINPYAKNSNNIDKKLIGHGYGNFYESHLDIFKNIKIKILEIGTWKGASVAAFFHYFNKAEIFCIDKNFKFKFKSKRIKFYNCNTENLSDIVKLGKYFTKKNISYFDVIIDDGSHNYSDMLNNFKNFFKKVKPGGYYIVEDFNHYKIHPSYVNDSPNDALDMEEIFQYIEKRAYFKSEILNKNFQNFCFKNISNIKVYKGIQKFSYIAFLKRNDQETFD